MITKLIETTDMFNHGKFLVGQMEGFELTQYLAIKDDGRQLSHVLHASPSKFWVLDCATCEGAFFDFSNDAYYQLERHQVWVCPMFPLFLEWAFEKFKQEPNVLNWDSLVNLKQGKHNALSRRRQVRLE